MFRILIIAFCCLSNLSFATFSKEDYQIPCKEQIYTNGMDYNRNFIQLSEYEEANNQDNKGSVIFLHGGPSIENEGQFDELVSSFTTKNLKVYLPEIEGSSVYKAYDQGLDDYDLNYASDIIAVLNHVYSKNDGKPLYIIAHSLGCHQLVRTLLHFDTPKIDAVCCIAGAWDVGCNRMIASLNISQNKELLNASQKKEFFYEILYRNSTSFSFGSYHLPNEKKQKITTAFNPSTDIDLNKRFSVLHQLENAHKLPPILLMHSTDDSQVCFQLSVELYKRLNEKNINVKYFFCTSGNHGFIKNDGPTKLRDETFTKINDFFNSPDDFSNVGNLNFECRDVLSEHREFLEDQESFLQKKFSSSNK